MDKREFLKRSGLLGVASFIPMTRLFAGEAPGDQRGSCVLIPSETPGPFPLDLTANTTFFRQDIREDRTGVRHQVRLRILGLQNCLPMQNVRVNIWHCDRIGLYSGYSQANNQGQAGLTYLRGYQFTDANGEVEFTTIFPGWYNGRICHIHFQVYVSSSYAAVSQLTFPVATKNAIYTANESLYPNGTDPLSLAQDGIFSDGYAYQMATLEPDDDGYTSFLEVTVQGSGTSTGFLELQNAERFSVGQNFPNPHAGNTTIPVKLKQPGELEISLWDLNGRRVATVMRSVQPAGELSIPVDLATLGLAQGTYAYQVQLTTDQGVYRDVKLMTAAR